jgi:hypothetical protein
VTHSPFKPDPEGRFPELLAVLYIRRQRGMHQLMHEDSEYLGRVGEIGPDDDFMVAVIGRAGMPALSCHLSFLAVRCECDGKSDFLWKSKEQAWRNKASVHSWRLVDSFLGYCGRSWNVALAPGISVLNSAEDDDPVPWVRSWSKAEDFGWAVGTTRHLTWRSVS